MDGFEKVPLGTTRDELDSSLREQMRERVESNKARLTSTKTGGGFSKKAETSETQKEELNMAKAALKQQAKEDEEQEAEAERERERAKQKKAQADRDRDRAKQMDSAHRAALGARVAQRKAEVELEKRKTAESVEMLKRANEAESLKTEQARIAAMAAEVEAKNKMADDASQMAISRANSEKEEALARVAELEAEMEKVLCEQQSKETKQKQFQRDYRVMLSRLHE